MTVKKRVFWSVLIIGMAVGWSFWHREAGAQQAKVVKAQGPVPVHITTANISDVPVYLSGIGNVIGLQSVVVRTQIDGQLMALHFNEGQKVAKGDLLAEIDARPVLAQLAKAKADKASNIAQLNTAKQDLVRYTNLLKEDAIAKQKVDQQKALVDQLQAAVQVAQADIDTAQVQLSYTKITSPINGIIGIRNVDIGNIVKVADANGIVTIAQVDPVSVIFSLPQENLADLQDVLQNPSAAVVDVLPKDGGNIIASGHLETVDNQIDQSTGTIRLKATIPNDKRTLWPGQFVVARIRSHMLTGDIALPLTAIQQGEGKVFVYRVTPDNKVEAVDVHVPYQNDTVAVVDRGLKEGDKIVIDGQARLKPGATIQIVEHKKSASAAQTDRTP